MSSLPIEDTMNTLFQRYLALSEHRTQRIACACVGMLLAGTAQLSKVARWLNRPGHQDSRVQFLRRLLDAAYVNQETVYQPLLRQALSGYRGDCWHVIMDRSTLDGYTMEILSLSLNFRRRAIPLVWEVIDFGCTRATEQVALLKRVLPLIPPEQQVVFHGDTEFGSVEVMRFLRAQNWHFILAQPGNTLYRLAEEAHWHLLKDLPVTPRYAIYLPHVFWTQKYSYGPLNVFAFYAPYQNAPFARRVEVRYCATSLPIAHTLRQQGRRRWGTECFYRDYKSSGWQIESSELADPARRDSLLTLLSVNYLWATCLGRWLCKTGQRRAIDAKPTRHLSLFRIGWDWLIHQAVLGHQPPALLTLYA